MITSVVHKSNADGRVKDDYALRSSPLLLLGAVQIIHSVLAATPFPLILFSDLQPIQPLFW